MLANLLPPGLLRMALPVFPWCLLGLGLLIGAITDLRARRVPNWLTGSLLACGLTTHLLTGGLLPMVLALAGSAVAFVVLLFPFHQRWIGAGDVKLLIALGSWLGPLVVIYAMLSSAVLGGVISLLWLVRSPAQLRREFRDNMKATALLQRMPQVESRPAAFSPPLAPAIAAGTAAVVALFAEHLILR